MAGDRYELGDRDVAILTELARDPHLTHRELADILGEDYGIDVTHPTISQSLRDMRDHDVYSRFLLPDERYFRFGLFEFKLAGPGFARDDADVAGDGTDDKPWQAAIEDVRTDKHTVMLFLSDGEYQWKALMAFPDQRSHSQWIHDFYKEHGEVVEIIDNSVVGNVLTFGVSPELFEQLLSADD